jgi:hypothetical protein
MCRVTVGAGALENLFKMIGTASRLEVTAGQTLLQEVIAPPPPALRARQSHGSSCTPAFRALPRITRPISSCMLPRHRKYFSSSSTRRSKQGKPTQGDDVVSPALLSRLQARLEEWHLASSSPSDNSSAASISAEETQDHLDLARMELKWMMDEVFASSSQHHTGDSGPLQGRAQETRLVDMVRRRVEEHEPLAYILGEHVSSRSRYGRTCHS